MAHFTVGLEGDGKAQTRRANRFPPKVWIDGPNGVRMALTATETDDGKIEWGVYRASPRATGCTCRDHSHHPAERIYGFIMNDDAREAL